MTRIALAPSGVHWTVQGEGRMSGDQMVFCRLAGCSVGCAGCDTDYSAYEKVSVADLVERIVGVRPERGKRVCWITGGEPMDQPGAGELIGLLKSRGWYVCLATSGAKPVRGNPDWVSVSPHSAESSPAVIACSELKVVDGLNGLSLDDWHSRRGHACSATHKYVQPLTVSGVPAAGSLARCIAFVSKHPDWSISEQRHHAWGVE